MKHSMSAGDAAMQSHCLKCTLISSTAKNKLKTHSLQTRADELKLDDVAGFTKTIALTQITDTRNTQGGGQVSI